MKLLADWKNILKKAWSIRLIMLAGLLTGAEGVLPLFIDAFPRGIFAGLSVMVSMGALVARVVTQQDLPDA